MKAILAASLTLSVLLLSWKSGYELVPAEKLTPDIALMLTPFGIVDNLLLRADSVLRPYYFELTTRSGVFDEAVLALLVLAVMLQAFTLLRLRKERRP